MKKTYITIGIIISLILTIVLFSFKPSIIKVSEEENLGLSELDKLYVPIEWETNGEWTWLDNSRGTINVTENRIDPIVKINSKTYEGDLDFIMGFPSDLVKPRGARLFKDTGWGTTNKTYTCEYEFNYTTNPLFFTCYYNDLKYNRTVILFEKEVDGGDIPSKTVWWEETNYWKEIEKDKFQKLNKDFQDLTWYIKRNTSFQAGQEYITQFDFQPKTINTPAVKYWIGFKPSYMSFEEAIETEWLILLDPWTASLSTDIIAYWNFENVTTTDSLLFDQVGIANASISGSPTFVRGCQGGSDFGMFFNNFGTDLATVGNDTLNPRDIFPYTLSWWANITSVGATLNYMIFATTGAGGDANNWGSLGFSDTNIYAYSGDGAGASVLTCAGCQDGDPVYAGSWGHHVLIVNETNLAYYFNSSLIGIEVNIVTSAGVVSNLTFAERPAGAGGGYLGMLDEIGLWNRTLTQSEIDTLYNGGTCITFAITPEVNITHPKAIIYNSTQTQLNYTNINGDKCWSTVNNGTTNSSSVSAGVNFTLTSTPNYNTWTVWCNSSSGVEGQDNVTFFVNISVEAELIDPIDNAVFNITTVDFTYNATPTQTNVTNITHFIWFNNGTNFLTNTTLFTSSNITVGFTNSVTGLIDSVYNWTAKACGVDVPCASATNRTFETHTVSPDIVITFPTGNIGVVNNGDTLDLNWTVTETGQNLSEHITNCSYTYNAVRTDVALASCVPSNETTFTYVSGIDNISFTVVDTFNFSTTNISTWIVPLSLLNETWNNITTEGASEDFTIFVSVSPSFEIITAELNYNGTISVGTLTNPSGNIYKATDTFTILEVSADTNVSFFWTFNLNDTSAINSTSRNQTIQNLGLDDCGVFTTLMLNLTQRDEEAQNILNASFFNTTIEVDLEIFSLDLTQTVANFSGLFNETNPAQVCLNVNLSQTEYLFDATIRYDGDDYSNEFYHFQRATLTNDSIPNQLSLYDLLDEDATDFQITFKDSSFLVVEDALINIARQYVSEGIFKTVEIPKTDSNGQTVAHLVENDIKYNIIVTKNGVVIGTFNNLIAYCEDKLSESCFLNLNAIGSNTPIFETNDTLGIAFPPLEYDKTTRVLTFNFITTDGSIKTVNLTAVKMDMVGNITACDEFLSSTSGTLTCNVPNSIGNETIIVNVFVDEVLVHVGYIESGKPLDTGDFGYFFLIFMLLSFPLMLSQTKTGIVIGVILGFIASFLLSFIEGGIIGYGSSGLWLIIAGIILIYTLQTKRET